MKKLLIFIAALAMNLVAFADNVATTPQPRHILIEDYTGIHCGNCPDAHDIINHLRVAQPELIHSIAIHAGYYAVPKVDQPDLRTDEGETMHDYFGISAYPSGMVDRVSFENFGGLIVGRSYWTRCARELTAENAAVNIWTDATYDKDTKKVSVDVELYYVNGVADNGSAVCVYLLQNRYIGPQAGADDVLEYEHNHFLRAMLTPVWGDTIATSTEGTLVKRHYEYDMPDDVRGVATDPYNSDILVSVISTDKAKNLEVYNACETALKCPGLTVEPAVKLEAYKILSERNHGFNFMDCYVTNYGNETVSTLEFTTRLNAKDAVKTNVNVNIAPREKAVVKVPVDWSAQFNGNNDYSLFVSGINGAAYESEAISGEFSGFVYAKGNVIVKIKTDNNAAENTYRLLDADGNVVKEFGPYENGKQAIYEETFELKSGDVYCFEITDAWGDGVMQPRGNIYWYDAQGNQIAANTDLKDYGYRIFFKYGNSNGEDPDNPDDPDDPDPVDPVDPVNPNDFSNSKWGADGEYGLLALPAGTNDYGTETVVGADGTLWFFTYSPESALESDIRTTTYNMYLQAFDKMGNKKFGEKGLLVSNYANRSWTEIGQYIHANSDSTVTVVIRDCRNTAPQGHVSCTAYRFRPDGTSVWDRDGVAIDEGEIYSLCCGVSICELTNGTNVFAWMRSASYSGDGIFIERCHVSKDGVKLNNLADTRLGSATTIYEYPMLVAGDDSTYYMAYGYSSSLVIYVQKYDVNGTLQWTNNAKRGVKIYSSGWGSVTALQTRIKCKSDGKGGIILGWNGNANDPYHAWIAWVKPDGSLGYKNSAGKAEMRLSYEETQTQKMPDIIPSPDGNGFIAAFEIYNGAYQQYQGICLQKIDTLGNLKWGEEGYMIIPQDNHSVGYVSVQPGTDNRFLFAFEMPVNQKTYNHINNYYAVLKASDASPVYPEQGNDGIVTMSETQYYRASLKSMLNKENNAWILRWEQYYKNNDVNDDDREDNPNDPDEAKNHHCLALITFDGTNVNWMKPAGNKLGDANGDGNVDVADITAIASHILGTNPENFNAENADVNQDGTIDVADITATAGIILGE